jgi:small subunit ribosomal protein S6
MLLLDTAAPDEQRKKVLADVERILSTNQATVVSTHDWGVRNTAFEIRHKADAEYHLIQFQGAPKIPAELSRVLRITDGVTRFRIIKLAPGTPGVPDLRASVTAAAEAAEPVEPDSEYAER